MTKPAGRPRRNPKAESAGDFNLRALYDALDTQRRARGLTWSALTAEVSRHRTRLRPLASSTITGLKHKPVGEGDGILQMLVWLERTPESFVPGIPDPDAPRFQLPALTRGQILRWDTAALFSALDARRQQRGLPWADLARELPGFTAGTLRNLAKGPRTGFPHLMRLVRWLGEPAVTFTRIAQW